MNEAIDLTTAQERIFDMLLGDDGQAWDEARKYLARTRPDLIERINTTPSTAAPTVDAVKVAQEAAVRMFGSRIAVSSVFLDGAVVGARAMQDAMAAALAAQAPGAVKVRELVWVKAALTSRFGDRLAIRLADTFFGTYAVEKESDTVFVSTLAGLTVGERQGYSTPEAAMTAAQAEREARVLSEIETAPPADGYVDAFYAIAKMLGVAAQPSSPKEVWEREIRPRLEALTAAPPVAREEVKGACPSCGCDEIDHRGIWTCRCPGAPVPERQFLATEDGEFNGNAEDTPSFAERSGTENLFHVPERLENAPSQQPAGEAGGLVERARVAVEWSTQQLDIGSWRPTRSRIEGLRNLIRDLMAKIEADATRLAALEARVVELEREANNATQTAHQMAVAFQGAEAHATKAEGDVGSLLAATDWIDEVCHLDRDLEEFASTMVNITMLRKVRDARAALGSR